jgi:7-cyano-7-deazaguanine synthase in queuosine biosynthesis
MWSGGIDSTYTLAKLLKETDHKVHAHHIFLKNAEQRQDAEEASIKRLITPLQKIRPFTYTETLIDHSRLPGFPYDMAVVCAEAGLLSKIFSYDKNLQKIDRWTIGTHEAEGHWQTRFDVIEKAANAFAWPSDPAKFELMPLVTKADEMRYLQELGLLDSTWFCRTPIKVIANETCIPCGKCKTCKEVDLAHSQMQNKYKNGGLDYGTNSNYLS